LRVTSRGLGDVYKRQRFLGATVDHDVSVIACPSPKREMARKRLG
jgi:hypothetical protein